MIVKIFNTDLSHFRLHIPSSLVLVLLLILVPFGSQLNAAPVHGIAMHGAPALPDSFTALPYVNPDAPKGGQFTTSQIGTFDSTNPFIIKGVAAAGVRNNVFESLLSRNFAEPFGLYGLIAQKVETDKERNWVAFYLNKSAKFSDGKPVRIEDVLFSLNILRDKGRPNHQSYYKKVARFERVEHEGLKGIKFHLKADGDREMPLILGLMPILPEHVYGNGNFDKTSLDKPVGSGPYLVSSITPGKQIVYQRDKNYWGKDLPVNRGRYNFDTVTFDYFRDKNTAFEAYKKGLLDYWVEDDPTKWATGYDFPAVKNGDAHKEVFPTSLPSGMSALVFNTRKAIFSDIRVRQALLHLFDAEWINKQLFHSLYARTKSYYDRSPLSSSGQAASPLERKLLAPFNSELGDGALLGHHNIPISDATGRNREGRKKATALFKSAGYALKSGKMINLKSGEVFGFEILVARRDQERLALVYAQQLKRAGIEARVRFVDSSQFERRKQDYSFDMIPFFWFASLSPGNEQSFYWGSAGAELHGTRNYMGANTTAIDEMIKALLAARDRKSFVASVRALDRVLMSGVYVIPLFYPKGFWVSYWTRIKGPNTQSLYGPRPQTWWSEENQR